MTYLNFSITFNLPKATIHAIISGWESNLQRDVKEPIHNRVSIKAQNIFIYVCLDIMLGL